MIISMAVFGTIGLFVKNIPLSSAMIALVRGVIGVLFLFVFAFAKKQKIGWGDIGKNIVPLAATGGFIGINWILLFEAYKYTSVANATLCYYLEPVFLVVLSAIIYKEKIKPFKGACILAALLGMGFVSGVLPYFSIGQGDFKGILLGIGAAVFYTLVILTNKRIKNISSYDMTAVQLGFAAIVTVPYILLTEGIVAVEMNIYQTILLLTMGIVHTGLAYVLYFSAVRKLSAQSTAILSYIDPMVAIVLSMTVLGEKMTIWGVFGAVLILGATFLSEVKNR